MGPFNKQIIACRGNLRFPESLPTPTQNISASILHNMHLSIHGGFQCAASNCGGAHCDKQKIFKNGQVAKFCSCFTSNSRLSKFVFSWSLDISKVGVEPISIENYCSDAFLKTYIFNGTMAPGVGVSIFNDWEVEELIVEALQNVANHVNNHGGWSATVWYKQGRLLDAAANPEGNNAPMNVERVWVQNGAVIYHLVGLHPSEPHQVSPAVMEGFKIDLSTLGLNGVGLNDDGV